MSELRVNNITDRVGSSGPIIAGVSTVTSTSHMVMPSGPTEMRGGRGRGVFAGGNGSPSTTYVDTMSFITIATTGNATDFGNLSQGVYSHGSAADSTRGVIAGGYDSPGGTSSKIQYTIISSSGGSNDFGDLAVGFQYGGGCNSPTLAVFGGAWADTNDAISSGGKNSNVLQFITIQTTGDSTEFGDLTQRRQTDQALSNKTRGCFIGGATYSSYPTYISTNIIDFVTFSSLGDAQDFGDLIRGDWGNGAAANNTRGIIAGGQGGSSPFPKTNVIQFITIATTGNAEDFGDLSTAPSYTTALSSSTRVAIGGGASGSPTVRVNTIQFITIASTGNATDFGDLTIGVDQLSSFSDVNGGIGD
tara:strand:+ start:283 stop:1365 length:1083 start_codon:yes stop_codon:yes gene_type:complete